MFASIFKGMILYKWNWLVLDFDIADPCIRTTAFINNCCHELYEVISYRSLLLRPCFCISRAMQLSNGTFQVYIQIEVHSFSTIGLMCKKSYILLHWFYANMVRILCQWVGINCWSACISYHKICMVWSGLRTMIQFRLTVEWLLQSFWAVNFTWCTELYIISVKISCKC